MNAEDTHQAEHRDRGPTDDAEFFPEAHLAQNKSDAKV
jgi:hypothetical protein